MTNFCCPTGQVLSPQFSVAWGNVPEASLAGFPDLKSNGGWVQEIPKLSSKKSAANVAREWTLRLPFWDLSQFKSILNKIGLGLNPKTIVEK